MHFQISLSLWELQVIRDQLCVRDIAEASLSTLVTVAYLKKQPPEQCRTQTFLGHTVFLKLTIGQFSDTQNPPIVVAECPKMFDIQCIWGRIFESLENIFVFKCSQTIFIQVLGEIYMEKVLQELFWVHFLGIYTFQTVPKHIWLRHCGVALQKKAFLKFYRKALVLESLFDKEDLFCIFM